MHLNYHSEFLTGTIYNWEHLLKDDGYKQILLGSFHWLVKNKKCTINVFVVMPDHFHMLWKISDLEKHLVNKSGRSFQFWEREPVVKEYWTKNFFRQKLNYIHFNPCQPHWNLAISTEMHTWSSASFYETGVKDFVWLKHFND